MREEYMRNKFSIFHKSTCIISICDSETTSTFFHVCHTLITQALFSRFFAKKTFLSLYIFNRKVQLPLNSLKFVGKQSHIPLLVRGGLGVRSPPICKHNARIMGLKEDSNALKQACLAKITGVGGGGAQPPLASGAWKGFVCFEASLPGQRKWGAIRNNNKAKAWLGDS